MNIAERNRLALLQSEQAGKNFVNQYVPAVGSSISPYGDATKEALSKYNFIQRLFPSMEQEADIAGAKDVDRYNAGLARQAEQDLASVANTAQTDQAMVQQALDQSGVDPMAKFGMGYQMGTAQNPEQVAGIAQLAEATMANPQYSEAARQAEQQGLLAQQQAMLEQEQGNVFRSNQIAAQEQALNPLAAIQTPTEQLAAATDADALARIRDNRPVPDYGTQTTMLNPYSNREQVIPHVGTPEFNKQQSGIDAGIRLIGQLQSMQSLIEDMSLTGTQYWGEDAKRFDTDRGLMATEMALLQELGVLSESDIELVLAGAEDVTSFGNNVQATILGPFAAAGSLFGAELIKGTSLAGYDEIQRFVESKITDYYKRNPYVDIDRSKLSQRMRLQLEPPER